ncbi:gamma-aminobutyraldehyde dehydrogenase domain protein, partial [Dictyocaulus viviparus]
MLKDVIHRLIDSPNNEHEPLTNFINNTFVRSTNLMASVNPATGSAWIQIPDSNKEDVNRAVEVANQAFSSWSTTSAQYRSKLLLKLADIIEENSEGLAILESRDQGKPVKLAKSTVIDEPIRAVNYVVHDPVGVAGLISPWNLPLYLAVSHLPYGLRQGLNPHLNAFWFRVSPVASTIIVSLSFKLAPALATGNTAVCKPSELTSVTTWVLMHAVKEA